MQIKNHRLVDAPYLQARVMGGVITPEVVVLHDTAGRLDRFNSRDYLVTTAKASVHFVVEIDGTISQLVPTNRRAGHAGQSSYHGRADVNAFSVGIEIVNPGRMTRMVGGGARAWFGQEFGFGQSIHPIAEATTKEHGSGVWMAYKPEQIEAVTALLEALFASIRTLRDITTHWYISPGRKVDTNPLFPLEAIRSRILGRDDPALIAAHEGSLAVPERYVRIDVPGSTLNVRTWPSFNPNTFAAAPDGAVLQVLREGVFGGVLWRCIRFDGREGWVVARYTETVKP